MSKLLPRPGLKVPEVLLYAERRVGANLQAIMVTRELEGYRTISQCLAEANSAPTRTAIVEAAARILTTLHSTGYQHSCMAGKHLLLHEALPGKWEASLLDFEKTRRFLLLLRAATRDLAGLFQYTPELTAGERHYLLSVYCRGWRTARQTALQNAIIKRLTAKGCSHVCPEPEASPGNFTREVPQNGELARRRL